MSDLTPPTKDRKFIAAAALVALIVVVGLFVVVLRLVGDDANSADPGRTASQDPSGSTGSSSRCGLPDGNQTVPAEAPPTEWYFKGKVAAPRSSNFGPRRGGEGDAIASCFSRNPQGALFAAATLAADIYPRDDRTKRVLQARAVPGAELNDTLKANLGSPGPISQIVGFRFEDYTSTRATVSLATRLTDGPDAGTMGSTPMTVVWRDGDWYLQLQASSESIVLNSLDGFVKWSGVS